jgi:hypothetical protein
MYTGYTSSRSEARLGRGRAQRARRRQAGFDIRGGAGLAPAEQLMDGVHDEGHNARKSVFGFRYRVAGLAVLVSEAIATGRTGLTSLHF